MVGLENGAEAHHRGAEKHGEHHHDSLLDLTNVVGGTGDERGGGEIVDFGDGKAEDFLIKVGTEVA